MPATVHNIEIIGMSLVVMRQFVPWETDLSVMGTTNGF